MRPIVLSVWTGGLYVMLCDWFVKCADTGATIIALTALRDLNLHQPKYVLSFMDVGGLEALINILESELIKPMVCVFLVFQML